MQIGGGVSSGLAFDKVTSKNIVKLNIKVSLAGAVQLWLKRSGVKGVKSVNAEYCV